MEDKYAPGETEAEEISYLIGHAIGGHRGHTDALWRALARDTSDCDDEGRWLRAIARVVVGRIFDGDTISIEERGRVALDALGLGNQTDPLWRLKEDISLLYIFDDLSDLPSGGTPTQIAKWMKRRGHFAGISVRNAAKTVTRILRKTKKDRVPP